MSRRPVKQKPVKGIDSRTWTRYATPRERELAGRMLFDMEMNRLQVVLVPAPDPHHAGHRVRHVTCQNPEWYSAFSALRDHQVHRGRVEKALRRICSGRVRGNGYEVELLRIAEREWPEPEGDRMNAMDDFASCGFCGKTVYLERISAPERWHPADVRDAIRRHGIGPGICPECGKAAKFVTRRNAVYEQERRREEEKEKTSASENAS